MEIDMTEYIPVLPVAAGALARGFASLLALVTLWLKNLARARRNRRQASQLAALDRHMLADTGIDQRSIKARARDAVEGRCK